MTGTLSPTLPTVGQPNSTEDPKVKSSIETLRDGINAVLNSDNTVMGQQAYRTILFAAGSMKEELVAGTYYFEGAGSLTASAAEFTTRYPIPYFYFDDADYLVTGKTLKLRLRAQVAANATKPTIKFTFGLYPITVAGAVANSIKITLGAAISTVEINEPAASTITQVVGADFAVPADGAYLLGVLTSAKQTLNNHSALSAQLQVRNI